jgi:molybdenum-dependent DNA-binding transcriptional regulator ModE
MPGQSKSWTAERQLLFLDTLARTRSVSGAAARVGMSRESAYRLRKRREGDLFAAAWERAMMGHTLVNFRRPKSEGSSAAVPSHYRELCDPWSFDG